MKGKCIIVNKEKEIEILKIEIKNKDRIIERMAIYLRQHLGFGDLNNICNDLYNKEITYGEASKKEIIEYFKKLIKECEG